MAEHRRAEEAGDFSIAFSDLDLRLHIGTATPFDRTAGVGSCPFRADRLGFAKTWSWTRLRHSRALFMFEGRAINLMPPGLVHEDIAACCLEPTCLTAFQKADRSKHLTCRKDGTAWLVSLA